MSKDRISQPRISALEIIDRAPILQIMVALGFERPRTKHGTRTKCILHGGDSDSFAFTEKKGTWYCHRCNEGGGKIKLVQRGLGLDSKSALAWIAELVGVSLERWTPEERRQYAARREQAQRESNEFMEWKRDMVEVLRERRNVYLASYHRCLRFIMAHSLNHPHADHVATMCEVFERRYQELDTRIATVKNASAEVLLSYFRDRTKRRAA